MKSEGKWIELEIINEATQGLICVSSARTYISIFRVKKSTDKAWETRKGPMRQEKARSL